jgi:hypothetical protein
VTVTTSCGPGRLRPLRRLLLQRRPLPLARPCSGVCHAVPGAAYRGYRDLGYYVIKHTDGNIMPILDQLVQTNPHALHSLDPQGHRHRRDQAARRRPVCLSATSTAPCWTPAPTSRSSTTSATPDHGMPGGGYIFSTSNCIYTGMPLRRYELMLDVWRREGEVGSAQAALLTGCSRPGARVDTFSHAAAHVREPGPRASGSAWTGVRVPTRRRRTCLGTSCCPS